MPRQLTHGAVVLSGFAFALPPEIFDQPKLLPAIEAGASEFSVHAPLSPIALYPDEPPTQNLKASAYPLPILLAPRQLEEYTTSD